MAYKLPIEMNRSALPRSVQPLFNPKHCFALGELTMVEGKPVLTGNCQVVQFGKNHTGNDCLFLCQWEDFPDKSYRPVLVSVEFDHRGRPINIYFGNSAAHITQVHDGTRASFGYLPPPPQPQLQPHQPDSTVLSCIAAINDRLKMFHKSMEKAEIAKLNSDKHYLKVRLDKEAADAAQAAKAAHAAALDVYAAHLKSPTWGCTSVLKGSLEFVGCHRRNLRDHHSVSLVEGFPYVECVTASAGFDAKFDMSPQEIVKITPYFKYDPLTGNTMYGASGSQFYDGYGFGNRFGAQGFRSFVVSDPNDGSFRPTETRQGSCPYPDETPVPPTLSALNPNTQKEWIRRLRKGNESLRDQMKALEWLAENPLVFPTGPIDSAFAARAFGWVRELSIKFQPSRLSFDAMAEMLAIHASPAAMHPSAMRAELFKVLTVPPIGARHINSCDCTPMKHNPRCLNHLCPFKHTRLARLQFEWPIFELFDSGDPAARSALESELSGAAAAASAAATAKQQAAAKAEAAEEKRRADQDRKNAAARQATALRKAAAAAKASAALASAEVAPAVVSRKRKTSAGPASASAAAAPASASAASPTAAPWDMNTERSNDSSPGPAPASAAPPAPASASSSTKRKARGGAKSKSKFKSKSKRRLRK
jgi:hypothetical protein